MLGRTPGTIAAIRPLKDGVIADFDVTEQMLRHFIRKVHQHRFAHPRVVVCVPSGVTGVEKRAVEEATLSAGARQAYLIEEPMAAAIGAGLPVAEPTGNMIVDIGGGTTEVAVISLGGIVVSQSLRVGGDEMDDAIVNHIKKEYKLLIGQQTAEEIKLEIGSAYRMREEVQAEVRGRDMLTGLPKTVILSSEEVRHALEEPVTQIIDAIRSTLDKTPPELAADIMDRGIVLAGGGALLQRPRRAAATRDADARAPRREPSHLRRSGVGSQPGGVRGDPPLVAREESPQRQRPLLEAFRPERLRGGRYHEPLRATQPHRKIGGAGPPRPASRPAFAFLPQHQCPQAPDRAGDPRPARARADHRLVPRELGRAAPRRPGRGCERAPAARGGRGAGGTAVPRRVRLDEGSLQRALGERGAAGRERAARAAVHPGRVGAAAERRPQAAARVPRLALVPHRLRRSRGRGDRAPLVGVRAGDRRHRRLGRRRPRQRGGRHRGRASSARSRR